MIIKCDQPSFTSKTYLQASLQKFDKNFMVDKFNKGEFFAMNVATNWL